MHAPDAPRRFGLLFAVALSLAACGATATGTISTSAHAPTPAPSLTIPVTTPEGAMSAVIAAQPRFAGIGPKQPDMIGQAKWMEALPASGVGAFVVMVSVGWGDCEAGCIDEHHWTYAVLPDGGVRLISEGGADVPGDILPGAGATVGGAGNTGINGHATAGPVCPVEKNPPDPSCAPRPVAGAHVVAIDASGSQVSETMTDETGAFGFDLAPGDYTIQGDAAPGLMGGPGQVQVTVVAGTRSTVDLAYDTGIR